MVAGVHAVLLSYLFLHDHSLLADLLHRKSLPCLLVPHQIHTSVQIISVVAG